MTEAECGLYRAGFMAGVDSAGVSAEGAYDRGYDDGWEARDKLPLAYPTESRDDVLRAAGRELLREVGLLGNIASCP